MFSKHREPRAQDTLDVVVFVRSQARFRGAWSVQYLDMCCNPMQAQNGTTALHNAAANGHLEVVTALLAAGADTDIQNSNGNTALHLAASKGERRTSQVPSTLHRLMVGIGLAVHDNQAIQLTKTLTCTGMF